MAREQHTPRNTLAVVYDFDGTLTPQPMQEYGQLAGDGHARPGSVTFAVASRDTQAVAFQVAV